MQKHNLNLPTRHYRESHKLVSTSSVGFLSNRVLKLNVGFLLSAGPGNKKDIYLHINDPVRIAEDLTANRIEGELRLTRAKEGILAEVDLVVEAERECARCLTHFTHPIPVNVQELYAYPRPIPESEFSIGMDAKLDLAPLLRAEVLIELSHRRYCSEDCQGLCPQCGTNLNEASCDCELDRIDPRMAVLKQLLDSD